MKLLYPAVFRKEGEAFWVEFPDLPGCQSCSDTFEETLGNAKESLEGWCLTVLESGKTLPKASTAENIAVSVSTDKTARVCVVETELP